MISDPLTDSTGWYRIVGLAAGTDSINASKPGFARCTDEVDIPCNDQIYWNPELRCQAVDFIVTVSQENRVSPVFGAKVNVEWQWDTDWNNCVDDNVIEDTTNSQGFATFSLAGGDAGLQTVDQDVVAYTVSAPGYDTETGTLAAASFDRCPNLNAGNFPLDLCAHISIRGVLSDTTGTKYVGYTVKAEGKNTGALLGASDPSDSAGNYALSISKGKDGTANTCLDESGFNLNVYAPNSVLVTSTGVYSCGVGVYVDCGDIVLRNFTF